jgi:sugar/nucleoside kinase (ribokinase family)
LRIAIASHIVLDKIRMNDGRMLESIGGPPCYCGITSRRFGFDVSLVTKAGRDIPRELYNTLQSNNIVLSDSVLVNSPTTKFIIISRGDSRDLRLRDKCEPLTVEDIQKTKTDCWLVSPVIDEISQDVLTEIKHNRGEKNFVMLDPQGYLRLVDHQGSIFIRDKLEVDLSGITAIKVDNQEMAALTGGLGGLTGMLELHSRGIEFVIYTEHRIIHLLHDQRHYWLTLQEFDSIDSTGVGDILCASFSCAYIKEKDPIWAICFGVGAVKAALETKEVGIAKIPPMRNIEETASYLYNAIRFERLS